MFQAEGAVLAKAMKQQEVRSVDEFGKPVRQEDVRGLGALSSKVCL